LLDSNWINEEIDSVLGLTDFRFFNKAKWQYMYTLLPKRCIVSKKILWFTKAYKGTRTIHGLAGESPVVWVKWMSKEEFTIATLMIK
jgi:hypothetical protein